MDDTREHQAAWTNNDRPLATGESGGATSGEAGGPSDYHHETAGPSFSKGGHKAGDPLPGNFQTGDRELTDAEHAERAEAQPDRH